MKAIKSILAIVTLVLASAAHALDGSLTREVCTTCFFVNASGLRYYEGSGDYSVVYTGIWDSSTNAGSWKGAATIGLFALTGSFFQTFTMDEATGAGVLRTMNGYDCTDTVSGAVCGILKTDFVGSIRNNSNAYDHYDTDVKPAATGTAFVPVDGGNYVWSFYLKDPSRGYADNTDPDNPVEYTYWTKYDLNVTLSAPAPTVPVPAAAWLFGSGLLGLVSRVRRDKRHTAQCGKQIL